MATGAAGTGAWRPGLVTTTLSTTDEVSFLASEHGIAKRAGITIDYTTVPANAAGDRIVRAGSVMAKIDSSGKYRLYDPALGDTVGGLAAGFIEQSVNCKDGDVIANLIVHGSVLAARTSGLDASARTDLAGRIVFQ